MSNASHLAISYAKIAFYAIFAPMVLFNLWRHRRNGRHALVAWVFMAAFVAIQLVGAGLIVSDLTSHKQTAAAQIVSGIGISPLLLGLMDLVAEVVSNLSLQAFPIGQPVFAAAYHALVIAAIALIARGSSEATKGVEAGRTLAKVGAILILVAWAVLLLSAVYALVEYHRKKTTRSLLLWGAAASVPVLLLRVLYTVLSNFLTSSTEFNAENGNIAIEAVLSVIPGFIITILVNFGGFQTLTSPDARAATFYEPVPRQQGRSHRDRNGNRYEMDSV